MKDRHPANWMYLLVYAIKGFAWAKKEVSSPEFDKAIKVWIKEQKKLRTKAEIKELEQEINNLREQVKLS